MTPSAGGSYASVLSHQHQYAGIALYLRTTGLPDTAALVDAIALLSVRTAFWHLRSVTTGSGVWSPSPIAPPPCMFADPREAVLRLRRRLQADLESTENLLAHPTFASHDRHEALTLHLQDLRRAHRMVADLVDATAPSTGRHDLEGRARYLKALLDASCNLSRASSRAPATRPRQPVFVQRTKKHLGRPRMAG